MDMRESLATKQAKEDSDGLKMVKSAIKVCFDYLKGLFITDYLYNKATLSMCITDGSR